MWDWSLTCSQRDQSHVGNYMTEEGREKQTEAENKRRKEWDITGTTQHFSVRKHSSLFSLSLYLLFCFFYSSPGSHLNVSPASYHTLLEPVFLLSATHAQSHIANDEIFNLPELINHFCAGVLQHFVRPRLRCQHRFLFYPWCAKFAGACVGPCSSKPLRIVNMLTEFPSEDTLYHYSHNVWGK